MAFVYCTKCGQKGRSKNHKTRHVFLEGDRSGIIGFFESLSHIVTVRGDHAVASDVQVVFNLHNPNRLPINKKAGEWFASFVFVVKDWGEEEWMKVMCSHEWEYENGEQPDE